MGYRLSWWGRRRTAGTWGSVCVCVCVCVCLCVVSGERRVLSLPLVCLINPLFLVSRERVKKFFSFSKTRTKTCGIKTATVGQVRWLVPATLAVSESEGDGIT